MRGARWPSLWVVAVLASASPASAEEPAPRDADRFKRRPASARYVDPESRFSLQGYATGTFADFQEDFPRLDFPPPGQLLVPRTGVSSFQYDWALFLGSRLSDRVSFVVETHFVTKGDGDFRPDIVTTEALVSWSPLRDPHALRVAVGEYWAPFAGITDDWLSAVNPFAIVPLASRAFPAHYNERGLRVEGEFDLGSDRGLNYVASVGNGVSGMSIEEQHGIDANGNKAVMGRIGFFPRGPRLQIGVSAFTGRFRDGEDPARDATDPRRYRATFDAFALDGRYTAPNLELRSYAVLSYERLEGAGELRRFGVMGEGSVRLGRKGEWGKVWADARGDHSTLAHLGMEDTRDLVVQVGLSYRIDRHAVLRASGFFHDETRGPPLRDNGFIAQLTASF